MSPKISMFRTIKVKKSQKFVWGLPNGICRLDPKSLKQYWNTKSTNQAEFDKMADIRALLGPRFY
jgi:hypothetical protein